MVDGANDCEGTVGPGGPAKLGRGGYTAPRAAFGETPKGTGQRPRLPVRLGLGHCAAGGFRLKELVALAGVLVVLSLVALAWRARQVDLPRRTACQEHIRQLLHGLHAYAQAHGHLPWAARLGQPHSNDWIYWQPDRYLEDSSLARFVSGWGSGLLRCPADDRFAHRQYAYSYSMNAHLEKLPPERLENPQALILVFEEEFPNDGACAPEGPADRLARRHAGRSHAGFMDGHVELIRPSAGARPQHLYPQWKR